jgi:hypothetical protein
VILLKELPALIVGAQPPENRVLINFIGITLSRRAEVVITLLATAQMRVEHVIFKKVHAHRTNGIVGTRETHQRVSEIEIGK